MSAFLHVGSFLTRYIFLFMCTSEIFEFV